MPAANTRHGIPRSVRTWGAALRFCRQKEKLALKEVASCCGASVAEVEFWEGGVGAPSWRQLDRMYQKLPFLRRFNEILPKHAVRAASEAEEAKKKGPAPAPSPPPSDETFTNPLLAEGIAQLKEKLAEPPPPAEPPAPSPPPAASVTEVADMPRVFGQALIAARTRRGWNQAIACSKAGLAQGNLSRYERGAGSMQEGAYKALIKLYPELGQGGEYYTPAPVGGRKEAIALRKLRTGAAQPSAPVFAPPPPVLEPEPPVAAHPVAAMPVVPDPVVATLATLVPSSHPFQGMTDELAQALAESREATVAYEAAMAAAEKADGRRKTAADRIQKLLTALQEAAGLKGAIPQ